MDSRVCWQEVSVVSAGIARRPEPGGTGSIDAGRRSPRAMLALALSGMLALAGPGRGHEAATVSGPSEPTAPAALPDGLRGTMTRLREEARRQPDGSFAIDNGRYRAAFDASEGLRFTPRDAGGAGSRRTWHYRATSLDTATTTRPLARVAPDVSADADHIVEFRRPGLIERYAGETTGVEQIFVLTERPDGRGDVRVRGEVTFDGAARQSGGGLEYGTRDGERLAYGAPVAFDATGRRLPVRVETSGPWLDLVLDGAALDEARFPVTIDPLIGAATTYSATQTLFVDVAFNWDRNEFLVVFGAQNPADPALWDIRGKRFHTYGDAIGSSFLVSTGHSDHTPRVAYDLHTSRYLVVWARALGETGTVFAKLLDPAGAALSGEIAISRSTVSASNPDVAARNFREHTISATSFVVVWRETDGTGKYVIRRERISGGLVQQFEAQLSVNATAEQDRNPRIDYDPFTDRFLTVWSENGRVWGRNMSAAGAYSAQFVISGFGEDPSVAFDPASRRFLVAWRSSDGELSQYGLSGQFLKSADDPARIGTNFVLRPPEPWVGPTDPEATAESGTFVVAYDDSNAGESRYVRLTGGGAITNDTLLDPGSTFGPVAAAGAHGDLFAAHSRLESSGDRFLRVVHAGRWTAHYVHGTTGDFDRDGRADLFLYRPASARWIVWTPAGGDQYPLGAPGDIPVLLDWDGDTRADLGTFRPSTGSWQIQVNATGALSVVTLGTGGDIPAPGDYMGDARNEVAVFSPATGTWLIRENGSTAATTVQFGEAGDIPVPADYDGDGKTELAVWRPSNGTWYTSELDGSGQTQVVWGQMGDTPLQGNFVGNGLADQVVFRPQERKWYRRDGAKGGTSVVLQNSPGIPMPLDYDGDGLLNLALFDTKAGVWTIRQGAGDTFVTFGTLGDIPAGSR